MKVIGLTGFAKSGKSTAASILKEMGGQEVAFAKHLKDVCAVVFETHRDHFDDQAFKEVEFYSKRFIFRADVEKILNYFEIPARFIPEAMLQHEGVELTTPRHMAQYIGTEILRSIDANVHINMAFKLAPQDAKFLICSDIRFENELLAVQARNGLTIGISRQAVMPKDVNKLHGSEREIPTLITRSKSLIPNETTIEEFQKMVKREAEYYINRMR